jgi:hypothetical protein
LTRRGLANRCTATFIIIIIIIATAAIAVHGFEGASGALDSEGVHGTRHELEGFHLKGTATATAAAEGRHHSSSSSVIITINSTGTTRVELGIKE